MISGRDTLDAVYRREAGRVLATLVRLLGDFDDAEEALQDAFFAAATRWPRDGVPANPGAWLVTAGRFRALDRWRRRARLVQAGPAAAALTESTTDAVEPRLVKDDELRLVFICCHPALPPDGSAALTLRAVGGLTTEEIARAYLTRPATVAQRIVRAKSRIRDLALPYELPSAAALRGRVRTALKVIYLMFNEAHATTAGPSLTRPVLAEEAIRLARLLGALVDAPEAAELLALLLLHDARRAARTDAAGDLVLLEDQDRRLWDRSAVAEAARLLASCGRRPAGPYGAQAAIALEHARAASFEATDWARIVELYDGLLLCDPSPVVALNRACAVAMRDGPARGLEALETVLGTGTLDDYFPAHASKAELQARLGRRQDARRSYLRALELTRQPAERRHVERRLAGLDARTA